MDFNKRLDIHTDASDFWLGAVIIQYFKPIAFYSRKLTGLQSRYTISEKELLSIIETLKGFCTILVYQQLKIYTDHKIYKFPKLQHQSSVTVENNSRSIRSVY